MRNTPWATDPASGVSRSVVAAFTWMPPVCPASTNRLRRTVAETDATELTCCTGFTRATIFSAPAGSAELPPPKF